jgi:hypothetical protein
MAFLFSGLFSHSRRRRHKARMRLAWTAVTLVCLGALGAGATAYSRLYVFGESLTETANLLIATGIAKPPQGSGNFAGNEAGALTFIEHLAAHLGQQANPSNTGGTNYAFGQPLIDSLLPPGFSPPSLAQQVSSYLAAAGGADPDGLYVVQGGGAVGGAIASLVGAGAQNAVFGSVPSDGPPSFNNIPQIGNGPGQMPLIFASTPPGSDLPGDLPADNGQPNTDQPSGCLDCPPSPPPVVVCVGDGCQPVEEIVCAGFTCGPPPTEVLCTSDCGNEQPRQTLQATADVPEPATVLVLALGLSLLLVVRGLPTGFRIRRRLS